MKRRKNKYLEKFIRSTGRNKILFKKNKAKKKNSYGILKEYLLISNSIWSKLKILKEILLMYLLKLANMQNKQALMLMNCEDLHLKSSIKNYGCKDKRYSF